MYLLTDASNGNNENFQKYKFRWQKSTMESVHTMGHKLLKLTKSYLKDRLKQGKKQ